MKTHIKLQYATKKVFLVSGRDYVSVRLRRRVPTGVYTLAHGVDHLVHVESASEHVRGKLHMSAGFFRAHPTLPNTTIVDTLLCIDLMGNIPASVLNSVSLNSQ